MSPSQVTSENVLSLWNPRVQLFACQNAALLVDLNQLFSSPSTEVAEKLPSELAAEWSDFFLEGISNLVLPLPVSITGRSGQSVRVSSCVSLSQWMKLLHDAKGGGAKIVSTAPPVLKFCIFVLRRLISKTFSLLSLVVVYRKTST